MQVLPCDRFCFATRQSSVTNGVTHLGQNGNTFRDLWLSNSRYIYFGDSNHYIRGGASFDGNDIKIRSNDDILLYSRWVRCFDTGSAGEYARISYGGSWINSNLSVNGHIKIGASGGGTSVIDPQRQLQNLTSLGGAAGVVSAQYLALRQRTQQDFTLLITTRLISVRMLGGIFSTATEQVSST